MKVTYLYLFFKVYILLFFLSFAKLCYAQSQPIVSDTTLLKQSIINQNGNIYSIEAGTVKGNNLFHSFERFNVPEGTQAVFNNSVNIKNIFSRITGNSTSYINGILKSNGSANLFLINPSGIVFGKNARLDVGGSFIATSANSINFMDGTVFSAATPQQKPLLTINVPVGLQFGDRSQSITVNSQSQLEVKPRNTLGLIAGNIDINGGILKSTQGNIELGSVGNGIVNIDYLDKIPGLSFSYQDISNFQDINLQQALINADGFGGGSIKLQGRNIVANNGSQILIKNLGFVRGGNIIVNASESLQLSGVSSDNTINTSLINHNLGKGDGGDIIVASKYLQVQDGAIIETRTYSDGKGGNLNIASKESVQVKGISQFNPTSVTGINAASFAAGNAGNITLSTANLSIEDGANISSLTLGTGKGGDVIVDASILEVAGYSPISNKPSLLSASTINDGKAGDLKVNTAKLKIVGGANVNTSTLASGNSGNIIINASEFIKIDGSLKQSGFIVRSNINSSATVLPSEFQAFLNIPSIPSGASGDVIINTPSLSINNGAEISVTNQGTGDAGRLFINASSLTLNRQGIVGAATKGGNGGNILLKTKNLQLRNNSTITATGSGSGNGGNIEINTDTLLALQNSDITANAEDSFGGKVIINAQGIFGIRERKQLTQQSDITASSKLGASFNGAVQLNTPGIAPNSAVVDLPTDVIEPSSQISADCAAQTGSNFTVTGKGGLANNPTVKLIGTTLWQDLRVPQKTGFRQSITKDKTASYSRIIEATGFFQDKLGRMHLVANVSNTREKWQQMSDCGKV
ncbi:MAG: filamentous hemagglutinin N-terminal domain-containing protein [Rivularia sp. (in: Bacteria)]|nr:filamentous hemagglutinin N-terminal domain-containing protein [Rivularia sp. MS3]